MIHLNRRLAVLVLACMAYSASNVSAQTVAFEGKTISIVNSSSPGGGTDAQSRLVSRHIGKYLPDKPSIIVRNMPGAGGLLVASYLYNSAPRDGTVIGLFSDTNALAPLLQSQKVEFDPTRFLWIGSLTSYTPLLFASRSSKAQSFSDTKKTVMSVGASGAGSVSSVYPTFLNRLVGTRFNVINGYKGSADINLAIERGEVDGYAAWCWTCIKANKPEWVSVDAPIKILLQLSFDGDPELNERQIPRLGDVITEQQDKILAQIVFGGAQMARPFALPPGVDVNIAVAIRKAFKGMVVDPGFLEDAQRIGEEIHPVYAEWIERFITSAFSADKATIARLRTLMSE